MIPNARQDLATTWKYSKQCNITQTCQGKSHTQKKERNKKQFYPNDQTGLHANKTKRKVIRDLSADGTDRIKMTPASGSKKAKENKTDSVIGIACYLSVYYFFVWFLFHSSCFYFNPELEEVIKL